MALLRFNNGVKEAKPYFESKGLVQESKSIVQVTKPDGSVYTADQEPAAEYKKDMTAMGYKFKKTKGPVKLYTRQEVFDAFGTRHAHIRPEYRLWAFVYYSCTLEEVTAKWGEQSGRTAWNFKLLRKSAELAEVYPLIFWLKIPMEWVFGEKVTARNSASWYGDIVDGDTADLAADEAQESVELSKEVPAETVAEDELEVEEEVVQTAAVETEVEVVAEEAVETVVDEVEVPEEVALDTTSLLTGDSDGDIVAQPTTSDINEFQDESEPKPWADDTVVSDVDDDQVDTGAVDVVEGPEVNMHGGDDINDSVDEFLI